MIDEKKLIQNYIDKLESHGMQFEAMKWAHTAEFMYELAEYFKSKVDVPDINVGGWTPCSERLPDVEYISGKDPIKGHYLTCDYDGNMNVYSWCEGWNCFRHPDGSAHKDYEITDVVAWMPLPEPYKEQNNG